MCDFVCKQGEQIYKEAFLWDIDKARMSSKPAVLKMESTAPRGPGVECRGSAIIQSNIGGPCTFKEKKREKSNFVWEL